MKDKILKLIENTYHKKYIGQLKINKLNTGYLIAFGLNNPDCPVTIIIDTLDEDLLLKLLKEELRKCKFHDSKYFTTKLNYKNE